MEFALIRTPKPGEDVITQPGQDEIFFGDSTFVMRGERQRHLVKTNINIRMMIDFLSAFGDSPHKSDAHQESLKLEGAANGLRAFRPIRNGF